MVSPFAMHQQQLAMLAQQQALLIASVNKSAGADAKLPVNTQQPVANGTNISFQGWPNIGYQIPGVMMPTAGQGDQQKVAQVDSNRHAFFCNGSSFSRPVNFTLCSIFC